MKEKLKKPKEVLPPPSKKDALKTFSGNIKTGKKVQTYPIKK